MKKQPRVLLVEDEPAIAELVSVNLRHSGFEAVWAEDGIAAQKELDAVLPDVILLDWMLPGQSGLGLARKWRSETRTKGVPILMLTARGDEPDKIAGLDAGADDYITKPFSIQELLARIRAVLRRSELLSRVDAEEILIGNIRVSPTTREAWLNDELVDLTATEFDLLEMLMRSAGRVVSREEITAALFEREATPYDRFLDVHISHLRRKLEGGRGLIRTVRGVGYVFTGTA